MPSITELLNAGGDTNSVGWRMNAGKIAADNDLH